MFYQLNYSCIGCQERDRTFIFRLTVERLVETQEMCGATPTSHLYSGEAHMEEQFSCKEKVAGSSPVTGFAFAPESETVLLRLL